MSEIKYRVWCKNNKEWEKDLILIAPDGSLFTEFRGRFIPISSENHHVMRYTGLNDRHDRAIYAGDFIKLCDTNPVIMYVEVILARYGYKTVFRYADTKEIVQNAFLDKCEVIGNIYENPELLQAKEG